MGVQLSGLFLLHDGLLALALLCQRLGVGPLPLGGPQGENCNFVAVDRQVPDQVIGTDSYEVGDVGDDE